MTISETILLISPDGQSLGQYPMETAERIAEEEYGLDLAEVRPGVHKILDLGKLKYEASKHKQSKAKPVKEMKFKLNIGEADYLMKVNHIIKFLQKGHNVKVTIWFSGREVMRPEAGVLLMNRISADIEEIGTATINPTLNGKNMTLNAEPRKNERR